MTPERWARVREVYGAVLDTTQEERAACLERVCGDDEALRRDVERLLAAENNPTLMNPVGKVFAPLAPELEPGATLGRYRIESKLGQGGMGAVYRAHDTILRRSVALKALPPGHLADSQHKQRLAREARAASALNHPNIVTVYDIGSENGIDFISMELVEGQPLDRLIPDRGLRVPDALGLAVQMAQGMVAAHGAGIVHRDLKPANVMVTRGGLVKLLDFGLARRIEAVPGEGSTATAQGVIAGTVAYMSPEQAEGKPVDVRSDTFSFGAVLYEMVSGRRAFRGETQASTLAAVISGEPRPLDEKLPPDLRKAIARCLKKDPSRRFQSMADVEVALREVKEETESGQVVTVAHNRRLLSTWWAWAAIAAGLVVLGWFLRPSPEVPSLTAKPFFSVSGRVCTPTFNPDGNLIAFSWNTENQDNYDIYVRPVGEGNLVRLTTHPAYDMQPAWSPDGKWIAFLRATRGYFDDYREIIRIPVLGGAEVKIGEANVFPQSMFHPSPYLTWMPDSRSVVVAHRESASEPVSLYVVSVGSEAKRRLTEPPAGTPGDSGASFSPDGRTLAFVRSSGPFRRDIFVLPLTGAYEARSEPVRVTAESQTLANPQWTPNGRELVYEVQTGGSYRLVRLPAAANSKAQELRGVGEGGVDPAISNAAKRLVYARVRLDFNIWELTLSKPAGMAVSQKKVTTSPQPDYFCEYSPDGSKFVFKSGRSGLEQLFVCARDGTDCAQITGVEKGELAAPSWSPDGRQIAFQWNSEARFNIYTVSATGGQPRRLTANAGENWTPAWSRDGKWIYFASTRSGGFQIWKMPAEGEAAGKPIQITRGGSGLAGRESMDGRTVYYAKVPQLVTSLWKVPATGGEEEPVLDDVVGTVWPTRSGIYFHKLKPNLLLNTTLDFFRFATGKAETLFDFKDEVYLGLSASPDERAVLYTQTDPLPGELMLVENFR